MPPGLSKFSGYESAVPPAPAEAGDAEAIGFVLALGAALHRYGTPSHRVEEALRNCCKQLGLSAEVFSTPTMMSMSFGAPAELRTRMMRFDGGELELGKLAQVDAVGDDVAGHRITPREGRTLLAQIVHGKPEYGRLLSTLAHGLTCGSIAVFFGGGIQDIALAAAIGLSLGLLAQVLARSTEQTRVFELAGAAIAAFAAGVASAFAPAVAPALVTVASLIVLLPGMTLTTAMIELATRNPIAGTARLMSAVVVLLELVVGVALGDRLAEALVTVHPTAPDPLPAWAPWVALTAAAVGVSILSQAHVRAFGWILAACVVGFVGSRYGTAWLGGQLGVLVGAFVVGVLSNVYARLLARPSQVVSVPAVLLLVPGSMGFRGMESLLDKETLSGVETVFAMFVVALAIVAGLLIANAVVSPRRSL